MTSQKSTNKNSICLLSLIREDMRHKTWMLALSILGSFLAGPVAALFILGKDYDHYKNLKFVGDSIYNRYGDFVMTIADYYQSRLTRSLGYLTKHLFVLMLLIACIGAMIVAFCGFRFLYHKRMVDLYHSAPVSRKKLFAAIWLTGFLIWFVPALASYLLVFPILVIYTEGTFFATIFVNVLLCLLKLSLCFLIIYNACLVAVMFSGNVLNAIVGGFSYGTFAVMSVFAYQVLKETFYDNCLVPRFFMYSHPLYAFSPMFSPILLALRWCGEDEVTSFYLWHLFAAIVIMILNGILSLLLYVRRPSELSERGIESKPIRITLRFLITVLSGIGFTMIFYAAGDHEIGWMLFGMLLGSALAFCVMNVLCHGTFKEAFSHKLQYALAFAACLLLFFGTFFDVTGYGKRLPSKDSITGLSILQADLLVDYDANYVVKDGILERAGLWNDPSYAIVTRDRDQIYDLLSTCVNLEEDDYVYGMSVGVKVHTKWGSYYRLYRMDMNHLETLTSIIETEEFKKSHFPLATLGFGLPEKINLISSYSASEYIQDKTRIEQLMNAYHQDFEENYGIRNLLRSSRTFTLQFSYLSKDGITNFNRDVPYWYTHTLSLIESWYPKKTWDPKLEDVTTLTLNGSLPILEGENAHDVIQNYYGFDAQGSPMSEPPANPDLVNENYVSNVEWYFTLPNVELLKGLEPYLIWGNYSDYLTNEYAFLGWASFEEGGDVNLYVRYGMLPSEILDAILTHAKVQTFYDYGSTPEYYDSYYD